MTKELIKAIQESIAHWQRMRKWVRVLIKAGKGEKWVRRISMLQEIREDFGGTFCALCGYSKTCNKCPLQQKYGNCSFRPVEFSNAWGRVNAAQTWAEWYKHSTVMLRQLKSLLPKKRKAFKEN